MPHAAVVVVVAAAPHVVDVHVAAVCCCRCCCSLFVLLRPVRACRASLLALMTAAEAKKNQQRQQLDKVFSFVETETEIVAITNTSTFCTPPPPPHLSLSLSPFSVCLHFCCCFRLRLFSGLTLSILLSLSTVIVWRGKEREMLQVALRCQLPPDCAVVVLHIHLFGSQGHHRRRHQQQQQQMRQQQPHRERQQQQRHCNGSHHHLHMLHFIYCSVSVCCRVFLRRITTATPAATTVNCKYNSYAALTSRFLAFSHCFHAVAQYL